jgi:hypothetical protein
MLFFEEVIGSTEQTLTRRNAKQLTALNDGSLSSDYYIQIWFYLRRDVAWRGRTVAQMDDSAVQQRENGN